MNVVLVGLGQTLVEAFAWGHAAKVAAAPFKSIDEVRAAPTLPDLPAIREALADLLGPDGQGVEIFAKADAILDRHPAFEDLREFLIDLCVIRLLNDLEEEDEDADEVYESPEWIKIETAAADRGTELLNVLIYIKECKLAEADPDLEDFLYEFLLVDDEDYQDELAIYEPFIKGLDIIEAPLKQLILAGNSQRDNEMKELFTPMMLFFRDAESQPGKITLALLESSALPELHCALYGLLCAALAADI
ncbi:MAG TPA: hypothetical protein VHS96_01095 [Bacteroidia bacterium]|nr:hypothetical protein [Bacteroidia bacterium]